jgi:undecaprenyl diphosphate synthase
MSNLNIKHLAVIMDGNRRWARARDLSTIRGHQAGVTSLKTCLRFCLEHKIRYLTAYTFSSENWNRTAEELGFLFNLLAKVAVNELAELKKNGIRVKFIGDLSPFEADLTEKLYHMETSTANCTDLQLNIALNYGAAAELTRASQLIHEKLSPQEIKQLSVADLNKYLYTAGMPDPEVIIRTGGKQRLSNFLLWQAAYAKIVFLNKFWPEISAEDLSQALISSGKSVATAKVYAS